MELSQSFSESFHTLGGGTIGEKKKSLNTLLQTYSIPERKKTTDVTSIEPKNYWERLLKIDVLIHFHKTTELLEILKGGNEIFISKIIKQSWFLTEVFCGLGSKQIVDEYLPCMSYSTRMKVLKKLNNILEENLMDEVFECLMERYGLSIATTVLSSCSKIKINSVLRDHNTELSLGQMKKIFNKDPELILTYLEEYKTPSTKEFHQRKFLTYVAHKDPEYFWKICENYKCDVKRLGSRTTKKILGTREDKLVNDPKQYAKYFRPDRMVRILGKNNLFKKFYYNAFPKNKTEIERSKYYKPVLFQHLLRYYPKQGRYVLFEGAYKEIIADTILNPHLDDEFLNILRNVDIREKLASLKYADTRDVKYLKYFKVPNSITKIQEKINTTSSSRARPTLIRLLIETCYINNDFVALEEVLTYFTNRHRHDDKSVRESCIKAIIENYEDQANKFTENHWKRINEILTIKKINNEHGWLDHQLKIQYLEFLFKNKSKQDFENAIKIFLEESDFMYSKAPFYGVRMEFIKNPDFEKRLREYILKVFPILARTENEDDFKYEICCLISDILHHNTKNPNHKIKVFEDEKLRKCVLEAEKTGSIVAEVVEKLITKTNKNDFERQLTHLYFQEVFEERSCNGEKTISWFAKNEPGILETYAEKMVKNKTSFKNSRWENIKKFHNITLERKLISACQDHIENNNVDIQDRLITIRRLAIFMPPEEYLEFCKDKVLDASLKLDLDDGEEKLKYTVGRELIKNLRFSLEPQKAVPLILEYCTPDYLQTTLPALYSAFYRVPENSLLFYINELLNRKPNSVLKHAVFLTAIASTKLETITLFHKFVANTNSTIYKNLIKSSLKYLRRNPCSEIFEITSELLNGLKGNDEENFELITSLQLPKLYKTALIIKCWDLFENLKEDQKDNVDYDKYQFKLTNCLDIALSDNNTETFCKRVIQKYFLKSDGMSQFVVKFLSAPDIQKHHFDFVFNILQNFKSENWSHETNKRKFVYHFFNEFYKNTFNTMYNLENNPLPTEFMKKWSEIFSPIDAFDEFILLNLILLKKDNFKSLDCLSKKLLEFLDKVFKNYSGAVLNKVSANITQFLKGNPLSEKIIMCHRILEENANINNSSIFMVIMNLISDVNKAALDVKSKTLYSKIDCMLSKVENDIVKLHYNLYLKKIMK